MSVKLDVRVYGTHLKLIDEGVEEADWNKTMGLISQYGELNPVQELKAYYTNEFIEQNN